MTTKKAILILLITTAITVFYFLYTKGKVVNMSPDISQEVAEMIAAPVLQECWGDEGFTIVSYSSELVHEGNVWRVGANYTNEEMQGQVVYTSTGDVPEVFIHAYNGGILDRHFSEIGEPDNQNCTSYGVTGE